MKAPSPGRRRPLSAETAAPLVDLPPAHLDPRGSIQELNGYVQVITSLKGVVRGQHRHLHGSHYCYVVSGALDYYTDDSWPPLRIVAGQMFYTPPRVGHAMWFREDTVMVVIGDRRRSQAEYEADLERIDVLWARRDGRNVAR